MVLTWEAKLIVVADADTEQIENIKSPQTGVT